MCKRGAAPPPVDGAAGPAGAAGAPPVAAPGAAGAAGAAGTPPPPGVDVSPGPW
jgi:hypothetical protein